MSGISTTPDLNRSESMSGISTRPDLIGSESWNPIFHVCIVAPLYGNSIFQRSKEIYLFNNERLISRFKISIDKCRYILRVV